MRMRKGLTLLLPASLRTGVPGKPTFLRSWGNILGQCTLWLTHFGQTGGTASMPISSRPMSLAGHFKVVVVVVVVVPP